MDLLDSCITVAAVISFTSGIILTQDLKWESINLLSLSKSDFIDGFYFALIRLTFARIILFTVTYSICDKGIDILVVTREGKAIKLHIQGFERLTFFTYWCWAL